MIPKFRVWLPDVNKMLNVKALIFEKNKTRCMCGYAYNFYLEDENATVMQSTGLFDKNGVEIFEGDVVKQVLTQPTTEDDLTGVVIMIECAWLIVNDSKQKANLVWSETNENEVLGNIYENPELMEGNA